jgi:small subunit ribosomal protein S7e
MRPRNRTLTAVHENLLDDLIQPSAIIGKRLRVRVDGSQFYKIHLDQNDKEFLEDRLDAIATVYKKLTTKDIVFEFRQEKPFYSIKK